VFAASLICCGITCSRCPCCWARGVDSKENITAKIDKEAKQFQEIDRTPETEITTWHDASKILKERKTIQAQKRYRQNKISKEAPLGAVSDDYVSTHVSPHVLNYKI